MSYADDIAKLLKERNNPKTITPQVGIVKSVSPLKISLFDGKVLLDSDDVLKCFGVPELVIGDSVLCLPASSKFILIDKVEVI